MLVYLKRTTLSARKGEGRACMDRRQAEWVLELQLKASFPPLTTSTSSCFTLLETRAIFIEEIAQCTVSATYAPYYYILHLTWGHGSRKSATNFLP